MCGRILNDDHVTPVSLNDLLQVSRRLAERHVDDVTVSLLGARLIDVPSAQVPPRRPRDPRRKCTLWLRPTEHVFITRLLRLLIIILHS